MSNATAATHLQADDLRLILDRLESVSELIEGMHIKEAKSKLGIARGFARASFLAATQAMESNASAGEREHFEDVRAKCEAITRLIGHALQKIDQGRAASSSAQIDAAIQVANQLIEAAERFAEVPA